MAKVRQATGSVVLGAELKRLRGLRTMKEISEMTRSEPFKGRVHPISQATTCQIESGSTLPTIWSLHALCAVYQVSAQHLLNCIVEERLASTVTLPVTERETDVAFREALARRSWYEALAHAHHGERLAQDEAHLAAWRANRGTCLRKIGLGDEALVVLLKCSGSPTLSRNQRSHVLVNVVEVLVSGGMLAPAVIFVESRQLSDFDGIDEVAVRHLLARKARLNLQVFEAGVDPQPPRVREAQRLIEQARSTWPVDDREGLLALDVWAACSHHLLKNDAVAMRDLRLLIRRAQADRSTYGEMLATLNLGLVKKERADTKGALSDLEHASSLAMHDKRYDEAFEAYFALFKIARDASDPRSAYYWKRCQRLHPLLQAKSCAVLEFERMVMGRP